VVRGMDGVDGKEEEDKWAWWERRGE